MCGCTKWAMGREGVQWTMPNWQCAELNRHCGRGVGTGQDVQCRHLSSRSCPWPCPLPTGPAISPKHTPFRKGTTPYPSNLPVPPFHIPASQSTPPCFGRQQFSQPALHVPVT